MNNHPMYADCAKKHPYVFIGVVMDLMSNRKTNSFYKHAPPDLPDLKPEDRVEELIEKIIEKYSSESDRWETGKHHIIDFSYEGALLSKDGLDRATIEVDYLSPEPIDSGGAKLKFKVLNEAKGIVEYERTMGAWYGSNPTLIGQKQPSLTP